MTTISEMNSRSFLLQILFIRHLGYCQGKQEEECSHGFAEALSYQGTVGSNGRQHIFPTITFTCYGNVTGWRFIGNWVDRFTLFPEFQIWRNNGSQEFIKVGSTAIDYIERPIPWQERYEVLLSEHEEIPVQPGDLFGVYTPVQNHSRLRVQFNITVGSSYHRFTNESLDLFEMTSPGAKWARSILPMVMAIMDSPSVTISDQSDERDSTRESDSMFPFKVYGGVAGAVFIVVIVIVIIVISATMMLIARRYQNATGSTHDDMPENHSRSEHDHIDHTVAMETRINPSYRVFSNVQQLWLQQQGTSNETEHSDRVLQNDNDYSRDLNISVVYEEVL